MKPLAGTEDDIVSLEIGELSATIAESKASKAGRRITRSLEIQFSSNDDAEISQSLRKAFDSGNFSRRKVRLNIPRHLITARFVKLPSTDDEEIKKIARMESLKQIPYADEDIISGYRIIEKLEDGYSNVLLAIAQGPVIKRFLKILKDADLRAESASLGSEALLGWYLDAKRPDGAKENVLIVNIDSDHVDIIAVDAGGRLTFTRGIAYGPEGFSARIVCDQVKVSLATHQKESGNNVDRIILTGAARGALECESILKKELKIAVEITGQAAGSPGAELFMLALKPGQMKIELLPDDIKEDVRISAARENLTLTLSLLGLILVVVLGFAIKSLHDKSAYLSKVNSNLAGIEPQVRTVKKMMKDANIIKEEMARRPLAIDILSEIHRITPPGASFNMLDYEAGKTIAIRGSAPALSEVFKYVNALEGSPLFENVKVKYANKRVIANREMADFEIIAGISTAVSKKDKDVPEKSK